MNKIYLGDCLDVLRNELEFKPESVDLIYIDPPFNSKRNYNVFFDDKEIQTQRMAFEDTWSLHTVADSLLELDNIHHDKLLNLLNAYRDIAPQVFPYLVMMTLRIIELHKVLKPTGSFYLHCDSTASHYLKTICDAVFGAKNCQNEIIWQRTSSHNDSRRWGSVHDTLLFYTKGEKFTWNMVFTEHSAKYVSDFYRYEDKYGKYRLDHIIRSKSMGERPNLVYEYKGYKPEWGWRMIREKLEAIDKEGRLTWSKTGRPYLKRYLENHEGNPIKSVIVDISPLSAQSTERLGYPTQKPKAILERIIRASSNEGDIVLDAFCGCGTSIDTAEGLNRQWIGIDIAPFAVSLIKRRLKDTYGKDLSKFEVRGTPTDEASAIKLWEQNPFAFEDWWLTELEVFATTYGKKGADKGIDGVGVYVIPKSKKTIKVGFQVKGGKVQSKDIDALFGAITKHGYDMGVLLTRNKPTKPMLTSAMQLGNFEADYGYKYPKLQIMTLEEFFNGKQLNLPKNNITFKSATTVGKGGSQNDLF